MTAKVRLPFTSLAFMVLTCLGLLTNCKESTSGRKATVFRYNEPAGITSLDPAFARAQNNIWAVHQLYNTLVEYDQQLQLKPSLAEVFEVSADGLEYRFRLKPNVYFHSSPLFSPDSTRRLTAHDVAYSLKRLSDPSLAAPGSWTMQYVREIIAVHDDSLVIRLREPFPPFLGILTMKYCSVVPREIEKMPKDWPSKHPVGTGPFYLKVWDENEVMILRKNPNYFEQDANGVALPYIDGIKITFITERQSAFLELLNGRIDMISGLDASYKDEVLDADGRLHLKYRNEFVLQKADYLNTEYLAFNLRKCKDENLPWADVRVRKAINLAIDKEAIIAHLRNGAGRPARHGFVPPALNPKGYYSESLDIEKAKALLSEAGFYQLQPSPVLTLSTTATYADMAELIQQNLVKIGIRMRVDVQPPSTLRQNMAAGSVVFYRGSWIADYADGENYLSLFYSANHPPAGPNYARFSNPEFDAEYLKLQTITDPIRRTERIAALDSLIMHQAAVIPLMYDQVIRIVRKRAEKLEVNPLNLLELRRLKIE